MTRTVLLIALPIAVSLIACKKPSPVSCMSIVQVGNAPARRTCYEYVGKISIDTGRKTCGHDSTDPTVKETFSEQPCSTDGEIAACHVSADSDDELVERCYPPTTVEQCQTKCTNHSGRFEKL